MPSGSETHPGYWAIIWGFVTLVVFAGAVFAVLDFLYELLSRL